MSHARLSHRAYAVTEEASRSAEDILYCRLANCVVNALSTTSSRAMRRHPDHEEDIVGLGQPNAPVDQKCYCRMWWQRLERWSSNYIFFQLHKLGLDK